MRLIVMRHAKSSWKTPGMSDHERPLNGRGRSAAVAMAEHLASIDWIPEMIISSDSRRTVETCELLQQVWGDIPATMTPTFYLAGPREVQAALLTIDSHIRTLLLLGHNHGWEDVVGWLSGEMISLKTASAALLECQDASWEQSIERPHRWHLGSVLHPKELD